jgi:cytoskeletal protein CcmA (bactofilin family)
MALNRKLGFFMAPMLLALGGSAAVTACTNEDGTTGLPGGDALLEECGLTCDDSALLEGNASVSGIQNVDAFFGAVVNFKAAAGELSTDMRAELDAIAVSVGVEKGAAGADIAAAVQAKFAANVQGGVTIDYQPAQCNVSAKASVEATAKCDASVDPGKVEVSCKGSCEAKVEADGTFDCGADVEAGCKLNAPKLDCEGKCEGSCKLDVAAECTGTCQGTCDGECSATNADGSCNGTCEGTCQGTCQMKGDASCSGSCTGSCIVEPANGSCEANATAHCDASANVDAEVKCEGECKGDVEPPSAKAECQASAKAEAEIHAECTPPQLALSYTLAANVEGDVQAKAEFEAWLTGFKAHYSGVIALSAKVEQLVDVSADLTTAASGAVEASFSAAAEGDVSLKGTVGLACAIKNLPHVAGIIGDAVGEVQASGTAAGEFQAELGSSFGS